MFPKGNNVDHLSLYLDFADSPTLPDGGSVYAQFSLTIVNQIHNRYSIRKGTLYVAGVLQQFFPFPCVIRVRFCFFGWVGFIYKRALWHFSLYTL